MANKNHHHNLECLKEGIQKLDHHNTATQKKAIFIMIFCTLLTTSGQVFWKIGLENIFPNQIFSFFNLHIVLGFLAYATASMLIIYAFKKGELSVLYPILATSYIWISIVSPLVFDEVMNIWKWVGILTIGLGITLLGVGSKK